ncbi:hypothetical protein V1264_013522 [Littorina saxatilis]|uniref:Hephaestin-like protein n=2 Tax=Littorina saxatilis TaxID=31220 RepID=A0AAN9GIT0_9CAEN
MLLPIVVVVLAVCSMGVESRTRTYYLAAVEMDWDYAPLGNCVNKDSLDSDPFIKQGPNRIGSVYRKILYRQFRDNSFSRQVASRSALGMLGPILRAETGDTIVVVFKNMAMSANRSLSVHPHGVQYNKDAEGALYVDQTTGTDKDDDGVAPGDVFRYVWQVRPSFAPTADDDACLPWAYHSHVASTRDVDSGLVGLLLTCKRGTLFTRGPKKDGRKDVAVEYPIYLDRTDENDSWLLQDNLHKCGNPSTCASLQNAGDKSFEESNHMSHVNGRMYGNLEGLEVTASRRSVFYFFSLNRGVTSVHFSGQVLKVNQHRVDSVTLFPATFVSGVMFPSNSGYWLMASRNVDSYAAGQQAYLHVKSKLNWPWGRKRRAAIEGSADDHNSTNVDTAEDSALELRRNRRHAEHVDVPADLELHGAADSVASRKASQSSVFFRRRPSVRRYYLGIEDYIWDYGPSGQNLYNGGSLNQSGSPSENYFTQGPHRIGGRYKKTRYILFSDSSFTTRVPRNQTEVHLGMLGPLLKAEVGETVEVQVKNMANRAYSFLPHGVQFTKDYEGFVYRNPATNQLEGRVVDPNESATYRFKVPDLGRDDLPCVTRSYHSALDPVKDINTGLVGPLLLCRRGQLSRMPRGKRIPDRRGSLHWFRSHEHLFLNFFTLDENLSWHLQDNINTFTSDPAGVDVNDSGFRSANRKHGINGRMFGNLEGLSVCRGDDVAWHIFGVGGEFDLHGVNFQGQTLEITGNTVNAKVVVPGTAMTLTSSPDTVGNWSVACRTNFHFLTGMTAKYEVKDCGGFEPQTSSLPDGVTRRYYVAAQEVMWDYAPVKRDLVTGEIFTDDSQKGYLFVKDNDEFIGSVYKKARYIEFTDHTFSTVKPRPAHQQHLGILGPVLKAEVGDVIEVVFFNNASRNYSMHPQGVQYSKVNEGAKYEDGAGLGGDSVSPGATFTYTWRVPERAGPGKNDPSCIAWMYYSSVNSVKDMSSGLVGPLLVCDRGTLGESDASQPGSGSSSSSFFSGNLLNDIQHHLQNTPISEILINLLSGKYNTSSSGSTSPRVDVDREFWMLYYVFDENLSWYLQDNIAQRAPQRADPKDPLFEASNRMNAINGLIYGNVDGLVMAEGDVVAWYLLGLGSSFDYHPVHFHGQTFTHRSDRTHRGDVLEVFPSTSSAVEMVCDNPGTWIVHCHFADHVGAGMEATYTILPAEP